MKHTHTVVGPPVPAPRAPAKAGHLLADFLRATPGLPGPARLALFRTWPPQLQKRAWAELREVIERERRLP